MSMKNNRETLNKEAESIREALHLNASKSVAEIFSANIYHKFEKFVEIVESGADDDTVTAAKKPVNSAIALYHDEMRMERLEQLKSMDSAEADLEYLRTQCVPGLKLEKSKDNEWSVVDTVKKDGKEVPYVVPLSAFDFINYVHRTEMNCIKNACVIFADNIVRSELGKDAGISRKGMSQSYINLRDRMGWNITGATGKDKLAEQLTEIFHFMMRGVEFKAIKADVKFVKAAILQGVDKPDQAGSYILHNEETIVNIVFRAGYTRINNLPYSFQNKTNSGNKKVYGETENKDMAEAPIKAEKEPTVTDETVVEVA